MCIFQAHPLYMTQSRHIRDGSPHMAIQINYYLYQNESQSHIIINKRRYQIETLDLKIRTNFHNFSVHWFQIVSK